MLLTLTHKHFIIRHNTHDIKYKRGCIVTLVKEVGTKFVQVRFPCGTPVVTYRSYFEEFKYNA